MKKHPQQYHSSGHVSHTSNGLSSVRTTTRSLRLIIEVDDPMYYGMKKIKIQGKDLNQVPIELFHLTELEVLDMSPEREACLYFKLSELPPLIGRLVNLQILILDTNDLRSIPPEIGLLTRLIRIALSNNFLTDLPREFGNLQNLQSLHLANNKFQHFPKVICQLKCLEYLDLCDNRISTLPGSIGNLRQLQSLLLYQNKLQELPDELCELTQLRCLWLGNNSIISLPQGIGNLKLLDWSWHYTSTTLDGNPLHHPPLNICKLGSQAISEYFQQQPSLSRRQDGPSYHHMQQHNSDTITSEFSFDGLPSTFRTSENDSYPVDTGRSEGYTKQRAKNSIPFNHYTSDNELLTNVQPNQMSLNPQTILAIRRGASPVPIPEGVLTDTQRR